MVAEKLTNNKQEQKEAIEEKHEVSELIQKYGTKMAQLIKLLGELLKKKDNRIIIFSQWDGMLHKVRSHYSLFSSLAGH